MHLQVMTLSPWTLGPWGRVQFGLTAGALAGTGSPSSPQKGSHHRNGRQFIQTDYLICPSSKISSKISPASLTQFCHSFQSRYNVPRSFLKPTGNLLVIFEEETGNPVGISLDAVSITKTCGQVSESHYPLVASWIGEKKQRASGTKNRSRRPKVRLSCPTNKNISNILFASFGTPSGDCQSHAIGLCHSPNSRAIAEHVSFFLKHITTL